MLQSKTLLVNLIKLLLAVCMIFVLATMVSKRIKNTVWMTQTENEYSNFYTPKEILFFTTGRGNATVLGRQLPQYIRSQMSSPSRRFIETYKDWPNVDHSVFGTSLLLDKLLRKKKFGFYVECGGGDGIFQSTSAFFELARNWTGLLIEGNLHLKASLLSRGRNAFVLNACLSTKTVPMWARYRNTQIFAFGGISDSIVKHPRMKDDVTELTCFPFTSVLDAIGRTHVDMFILDIQGPELYVLKTIDFNRYRIDFIVVEYVSSPRNETVSAIRIKELRQFFQQTQLYKEYQIATAPYHAINVFDAVFYRRELEVG